ncbi:MAG TPA: hypothetical protein VFP72_08480 [Kineosporiaceae bacterium]|nr:hypothetical protein [Kineosporiaceae bacterium]
MTVATSELMEVPEHWPLRSLFGEICDLCAEVYRDAWQSPLLRLAVPRATPRTGTDRAAAQRVTAVTTRPEDGPPVVQLTLSPQDFRSDSVPDLARLLVHACFCEVVTGHAGGHPGSPFVEGWLDWAADYPFRRWVARYGSPLPAARPFEGSPDLTVTIRSAAEHARAVGRAAAERLCGWWRGSGCVDPTARVLTARLALEVNLADRDLARKDGLTVLLGQDHYPAALAQALDAWSPTPSGSPRLQAEQVIDTVMD